MPQTRGSRDKLEKGQSAKKRSAATGKAKSANVSQPTSEGEYSDSQVVGSSQKRKRSSKKAPVTDALQFDQLPPAMQKQLLKQAQKQAKTNASETEAGKHIFVIHTKDLLGYA